MWDRLHTDVQLLIIALAIAALLWITGLGELLPSSDPTPPWNTH